MIILVTTINTPQSHLNQTTEILLDMVSDPQFLPEDIQPEIGVVFEEYRRSQDNPSQYSFSKIQETAFTGPYSHMILGNPVSINRFSQRAINHFLEKTSTIIAMHF